MLKCECGSYLVLDISIMSLCWTPVWTEENLYIRRCGYRSVVGCLAYGWKVAGLIQPKRSYPGLIVFGSVYRRRFLNT